MPRFMLCLTAAALAVGCGVGADLKSGPPPGQSLTPFHPLNVTGPDAGEKACLIWKNGGNPVVAIFARDLTPTLTGLVMKIDDATQKNADARMGSFVVMLSDDDKLEGKLKELAEAQKLKKTVLTIDNPGGPEGYDIAKDADVTVVLYAKKKVVKTLAYGKGKLDDKAIGEVVSSVKDILPKKDS